MLRISFALGRVHDYNSRKLDGVGGAGVEREYSAGYCDASNLCRFKGEAHKGPPRMTSFHGQTDVEEQRRQQLAAELIRNARSALDEGGYARCLEILKQAAEVPPPAEAAQEIDRLRQAAGEARLRARARAEEAGDRAAQGRRSAAAADTERHAATL